MIFGQLECDKCGGFFDPEVMTRRQKEIVTGRSGPSHSLSTSLYKSKSARLTTHSGKKFYKLIDVYHCPECEEIAKKKDNAFTFMDLIQYLFLIYCVFFAYKLVHHILVNKGLL